MDIAFVTLHKLEIFFSLLLCVAVSFINLCCGGKKSFESDSLSLASNLL